MFPVAAWVKVFQPVTTVASKEYIDDSVVILNWVKYKLYFGLEVKKNIVVTGM